MKSMTGYGRGEFENKDIRIVVEIKSVNGKALRVRYGLPRIFYPLINDVKREIESVVKRGELDVSVSYHFSPSFRVPYRVNYGEALELIKALSRISSLSGKEISLSGRDLLSIPEIFVKEELNGEEFKGALLSALRDALIKLDEARRSEGEKLKLFFAQRLKEIEELLKEIEKESLKVKELLFKRLTEKAKELLSSLNVDEEFTRRVELEVAILAAKHDVSEELSRLWAHLKRFKELMEVEDEPIGKSLDFLCQEMHREVNTLGNKLREVDVTDLVVKVKGEIAKIKEQVQNVE
ncbi:YicC/YloC family endoribonuclease [Thermovibrio sp.]